MIQGVNLGGWFIPERWMSPRLFQDTEADCLHTLLREPDGRARYEEHLKTWIGEEDFRWLVNHKINLVRLPIGYWALDDDERYPSTKVRLDWAFAMAEKYNLQILLDLHALKGSQNGKDHSGKSGAVDWWRYHEQMIAVLVDLARRYRDSPALWGIEIINEPKVFGYYFKLLRYYRASYRALTRELRPGQYVVFQDGFLPLIFTGAIRPVKSHPVAMDTHFYGLPPWLARTERAYGVWQRLTYGGALALSNIAQPVIVGEWSGVLPQRLFDRFDQNEHHGLLVRNIARQQQLYMPALATMYWNYKIDGKGMWSLRSLVDSGDMSLR